MVHSVNEYASRQHMVAALKVEAALLIQRQTSPKEAGKPYCIKAETDFILNLRNGDL